MAGGDGVEDDGGVITEGDAVDAGKSIVLHPDVERGGSLFQAEDAVGSGVCRVSGAVGPDGDVVTEADVAGEIKAAFGGAGFEIERLERSRRAFADFGRADPERVGFLIDEHAEHTLEAVRARLDPGFGSGCAFRGFEDYAVGDAADVERAVGSGTQAFREGLVFVDSDFNRSGRGKAERGGREDKTEIPFHETS